MKGVTSRLPPKPSPSKFDSRSWLLQMKGGDVALEKDASTGIATIRLDQPSKKNACSGHMMVALDEVVTQLESWEDGKGLIVCGAGGDFCSGADLDTVRKMADPTGGARMSEFMQSALYRLSTLPLVSVALLEGAGALGGGAEIAMACDWRLIAPGCNGIGFVHKRMGIAPAWGGSTWLTRTIGYRRALDLMTTGRLVSGREALDLGVVDALLSSLHPMSEALHWLNERTEGSPQVVRAIKLMAINSCKQTLDEVLEEERNLFAPLWGGPANLKALDSNIKHRK